MEACFPIPVIYWLDYDSVISYPENSMGRILSSQHKLEGEKVVMICAPKRKYLNPTMITQLNVKKTAIALPLKITVFAKGKKAITISKNRPNCLNNFVIISTGVVNLNIS